jgi:hypothetical protein
MRREQAPVRVVAGTDVGHDRVEGDVLVRSDGTDSTRQTNCERDGTMKGAGSDVS